MLDSDGLPWRRFQSRQDAAWPRSTGPASAREGDSPVEMEPQRSHSGIWDFQSLWWAATGITASLQKRCVSESNGVKVTTHLHSSRFHTASAAAVCVCLYTSNSDYRSRAAVKASRENHQTTVESFISCSCEHLGMNVWESLLEQLAHVDALQLHQRLQTEAPCCHRLAVTSRGCSGHSGRSLLVSRVQQDLHLC